MPQPYDRKVPAPRVLIVEDDPKTSASIEMYLRHEGYAPSIASTGVEAMEKAQKNAPDLVILDVMLPGKDGVAVCRTLRERSRVPIIMLTARSTEEDKLRGLDSGADDYITKPFSPRELMARVRAVLRRSDNDAQKIISGDMVLDPASREVTIGDVTANLTRTEFSLLHILMRSPGRVFTREELIARAFGDAHDGMDRTIDAHIKNLRRKIDPSRIVTVFGVGYKFT
jgi:two-component system alkaline phosphatase synthesis response regulator PhoP